MQEDEDAHGPQSAPTDQQIILENQSQEILDHEKGTLDYRKQKATGLRDCPRLILPGPRPDEEEQQLHTQETMLSRVILDYKSKRCTETGRQRTDALTKQERRGYKKLQARVKRGEVVVSTTDKSSKLSISTYDEYIKQGQCHVAKDEVVSWSQVQEAKRDILCHTKALSNMFRVGRNNSEKEEVRLRKALHEDSTVIPQMTCLQKDHKQVGPD